MVRLLSLVALFWNLTDSGTALTGAGTVVCPTNTKLYIVDNNTAEIVTVKTSGGTGVAVPVGKTMLVYCDGTNVVEGVTHANSLEFGHQYGYCR